MKRLILALGATVLLVSTSLGTATATTGGHGTAKQTIVLVHGAFADASGWNAEIAALRKLGHPVPAASDPLRGLSADADYVRSVLSCWWGTPAVARW